MSPAPPFPSSSSPYSTLRPLHRSATTSFLLRDYISTSHSLSQAFTLLPTIPPSTDLFELKRKLQILRISLFATVLKDSTADAQEVLGEWGEDGSKGLIEKLWKDLLLPYTGAEGEGEDGGEIVATSRAREIHPSLATTLGLSAMKLGEVRLAKEVCESWFGSVGEEMEKKLLEGGTEGKLMKSWIKLWELLVLHVLPQLEEWDAAGDWCLAQKPENGGWLDDALVETTMKQLEILQTQSVLEKSTRGTRQLDLLASSTSSLASTPSSTPRRKTKSSKSKGNEKEDTTSGSSSGGSPGRSTRKKPTAASSSSSEESEKKLQPTPSSIPITPPATGFAALRGSLTNFLASTPPASSPIVKVRTSGSLIERIQKDPIRMLGIILLLLGIGSWLRRWRRDGGRVRERIRKAMGLVGETLKMGVKVTSL